MHATGRGLRGANGKTKGTSKAKEGKRTSVLLQLTTKCWRLLSNRLKSIKVMNTAESSDDEESDDEDQDASTVDGAPSEGEDEDWSCWNCGHLVHGSPDVCVKCQAERYYQDSDFCDEPESDDEDGEQQ